MVSLVLDGGPSDHNPFIKSFFYKRHLNGFTAVTYNVEHSSTAKQLSSIFDKIQHYHPGIWILQEVKDKAILKLLTKFGLEYKYARPEFAIAWSPERFTYVRSFRKRMAKTVYWTVNYALVVVLKDKITGTTIKVMSYHPPAHVQSPKEPSFKVVTKVLHEVVNSWNRIAEQRSKDAECLFAGDDNVDEGKGWTPPGGWKFMLKGPLTQVQAPKPTRGNRRIDSFRISDGLSTS